MGTTVSVRLPCRLLADGWRMEHPAGEEGGWETVWDGDVSPRIGHVVSPRYDERLKTSDVFSERFHFRGVRALSEDMCPDPTPKHQLKTPSPPSPHPFCSSRRRRSP